jgi:hypothetical protein
MFYGHFEHVDRNSYPLPLPLKNTHSEKFLSNGAAYFSAVTTVKRIVQCAQDTQCTMGYMMNKILFLDLDIKAVNGK